MKFVSVIGLEIHAELKTKSKIFCGCANKFGIEKNSCCCPVCIGLPGSLPVLNREAVELAIAAGLMLGCDISKHTKWDRKNYFYPDLSKAYQISQLYSPLCIGGGIEINKRFIRLNRIHLEEDAGKLIHEGELTLIDYNRAGVPLVEIVTEPDLRTSDEAVDFVERIRQTLIYADVCDGKMEQGSLRVDANISIMEEGANELGTRTEIKNLNSFKFIKKAIDFEIKRQEELINEGGKVIQETRRYDEVTGETFSMRSKENAHDYRYFPDPDILPLCVSNEDVEQIKDSLSEAPYTRFLRYTTVFGLSERDAETILTNRFVADFYDVVIERGANPKNAANVIKGEVLRCINNSSDPIDKIPIEVSDFIKILDMANKSEISQDGLKLAIKQMYFNKKCADDVIQEFDLVVKDDVDSVRNAVREVLDNNQSAILQYKSGNEKIISYFFGQCNKLLKGKALPKTINAEIKTALDEYQIK